MPKIVIIDANSLLYRAFFALPYLSTSGGIPTNAVLGFAMMMSKLMEDVKPDYAVAAFEGGKTFRHDAFEDYKANRPERPDELAAQDPLSRELLEAMGIPILVVPGYEADDVVGTISKLASQKGMETLIVSGDLDSLQLVQDHVRVMTNRKGITDTVIYDREGVRERFGIEPEQLPDFKALKGDTSDNIPGVPGIGDKTASSLIQQFGSIESLLANADQIEKPKVRESVKNFAEQIKQAKVLATIVTNLDLESDLAKLPQFSPNKQALLDLYNRLEFRVLARKLESLMGPTGESEESSSTKLGKSSKEFKPVKIQDAKQVGDLIKKIQTAGSCAFRIQAGTESPYQANVTGIAYAVTAGEVYYVPINDSDAGLGDLFSADSEWGASLTDFSILFKDSKIIKHGHDLKRDYELLKVHQISFEGIGMDVMLAAYLIAPGRESNTLETISREVLGITLNGNSANSKKSVEISWEDICQEADVVLQSVPVLEQILNDQSMARLFKEIEMPLMSVLAEMELHGVAIDKNWLRNLSSNLSKQIHLLETEIYALAGTEFNIGSPKQLQEILFEKMQIPTGKKTKTGYSTGVEVLEELAPKYEIAGKILQYRELTKLKGTYTDSLIKLINSKTGRIHTSLNQAITATGRLSSSDPNLQNIPVRTEEGREIRRAFIPCNGMDLISADYSQIELRILADMSQDIDLIKAFQNHEDIHTHTASVVFGVPESEVNSEMRRRAKAVNFGIVYGISDFGLARDLSIPQKQAHDYISGYFERFPKVKEFIETCISIAREKGYSETMFGRRRSLPDLNSKNRNLRQFAERNAVNSKIQGTAADVIKIAMIRMQEKIPQECPSLRMIMQVHDELLFEVPPSDRQKACVLIKEVMEKSTPLSVPLEVEIKYGPNWSDMESMNF